ncbi:DNA topoisomerase [Ramlibacter sp. AN1133]|uniref:DNA topoisomerase n=1 Tax=Ramlibacter sp. AN1133 TaxID=3133429 RepID=UPI0030C32E4E
MKVSDFQEGGQYRVGRVIGAVSATYEKCETEPPRRYTQSDLIDDMMAAHKFAPSEQERQVLRQIDGLGTSRTRESTISGLLQRGFLEEKRTRRGRAELVPTPLARSVVQHLPAMLTSVATTAKWELAFRLIEQGKAEPEQAQQYLRLTLQQIVKEAQGKGRIEMPAPPPPPTRHFGKTPPASNSAAKGRTTARL